LNSTKIEITSERVLKCFQAFADFSFQRNLQRILYLSFILVKHFLQHLKVCKDVGLYSFHIDSLAKNDCHGGPPHKKLLPQQEHSRQPQSKNQRKPYGKQMQLKDTKIKIGG
jgi:hypothetical protein